MAAEIKDSNFQAILKILVDIDESPETKVKDNNTSIDIEEKKNNNEGETVRERSHNELKADRVVMNFDLNEIPMKDETN